jgi:selenocysteine lyase/cysteine desulfurase
VAEEAARFLREDAGNPGRGSHRWARRASEALERARLGLAGLIGAKDAARLALTSGATEGLNVALRGLLGAGDRVLVGAAAHNAVLRPLHVLGEERGVVGEEVACDDLLRWDLDDLERRLRDGPVAAVVVSHGSNVTGAVQDVATIARLAREVGARVVVDAAQTVGALPLDVESLGVDALAFSGHKALGGPPGTGGLYVRAGLEVPPLRAGGTGTQSEDEEPPRSMPAGLEAGTPNAVGFAALAVAVEWAQGEGVEVLHARAAALGRSLFAGLAGLPVTLHAAQGAGDLPVGCFTAGGWDPQELAMALDGAGVGVRAGLHCAPRAHRRLGTAPAGAVRVSLGPLQEAGDGDRLLEVLGQLLGGGGLAGRSPSP